jgi:chaperonin GroEL
MPKQILFDDDARRALKCGVDTVAAAVKTTLGPRGCNVALGTPFGAPTITHDGVTVAKEIVLDDPFANMGARMLIEVATRTNDLTGDGTTTATVLAQAMIAEGMRMVAAGANPMQMKRGLDKGVAAVIAELERMATPVRGRADIAHVAGIAAGDPAIGELIAEIMERVGKDGVITVEAGQGLSLAVDYSEGMQLAQGYLSPHFVTDTERMKAELDDPLILITDHKLAGVGVILPALEAALAVTKNIVIIAPDIDGEALATLVINRLRGTLNAIAVRAPSFGDQRQAILQDLATLTGGTLISAVVGRTLESVTLEEFGRARRVVAEKDTTTVIEGRGDKAAITARTAQIRAQIELVDGDFAREQLRERLAKLEGGVAVLKVGGPTELALRETKQRVEDALATARAAVAEGIVPGGGVALINASCGLEQVAVCNADERFGVQILRRALDEPLRQLAINAGAEGEAIIETVRRGQHAHGDQSYGYNVLTGEFGSMLALGVVDPVKVTRLALLNAASVAGLLLTTEVLIADIPED